MTQLQQLSDWARAVRPADVPPEVRRLALLQHLGAAGAARATLAAEPGHDEPSQTGDAIQMGGGRGAPDATAAWHAGLQGAYAYDDFLLGGSTGPALTSTLWALAPGHSLDALITATVIGNELAGRIGLSDLRRNSVERDPRIGAVAAAAAAAWLKGRDSAGLSSTITNVLSSIGRNGDAATVSSAVFDALDSPAGGPTDILEEGGFFYDQHRPFSGAFSGLGRTWLTKTLVIKPVACADRLCVAVQGIQEILRRHIKAAEKRLRCDQIEKVLLQVSLPTLRVHNAGEQSGDGMTALTHSLRQLVGILLPFHDLTPQTIAGRASRDADVQHVAGAVEVQHLWKSTLTELRHVSSVLQPVVGHGVGDLVGDLRSAVQAFGLPGLRGDELGALMKSRPDQAILALLGAASSDGLADVQLDDWQWQNPVEIKLYTNRGGWWPERRAVPSGSVAAGDIEKVARDKFANGDASRAQHAVSLVDTPSPDAATWVSGLLA